MPSRPKRIGVTTARAMIPEEQRSLTWGLSESTTY